MCFFDTRSPGISVLEVHELIYNALMLERIKILMVQMDRRGCKLTLNFGSRHFWMGFRGAHGGKWGKNASVVGYFKSEILLRDCE
jgi:hypothetical protein